MSVSKFNIRVYAILIQENKILVTDEYRFGRYITKFPGGGLEFGEGTVECIKRECLEELGQEVEVISHFYTTDFFQVSAFNSEQQIMSIYYLVLPVKTLGIKISDKKFDFPELKEEAQSFRFISIAEISPDDFTFPIDKKVAVLLMNQ